MAKKQVKNKRPTKIWEKYKISGNDAELKNRICPKCGEATIMAEHKPTKQEFIDPKRMREVFYHVGSDLIEELANSRGINLSSKELDELTQILIRYTVGFGLIEVLLNDEFMQDISGRFRNIQGNSLIGSFQSVGFQKREIA